MAITPQDIPHKQESQPLSENGAPITAEAERTLVEAEQAYRRGLVTIYDLIAPSAMKVTSSHVELSGRFLRTLFVTTYPRYISVGWFAPVINYPATIDISMFFYPVDSGIVLKQLRNQVGNLQAQLSANQEKGAPRDPKLETALRDIEELRDSLTQGVEKFFQFALYVTLYASSLDELNSLTEKFESIFGTSGVFTRRALWQTEQGFTSTLPIAQDDLEIAFNMNSSPIASSFPFISSELTSGKGIMYGLNLHNNSLIVFDRFSLQNANLVCFASAGAGKSYAIKLEVLRSLMMGTDVIIIDPEMEYKHLSDAVGGTYINVSLSSEAHINPFDLPRPKSKTEPTENIIRSAVITAKGLLRLMLGSLTVQEDSLLDRALIETYRKKDITPQSDLVKSEPPVMSDLQEILEGMEGTNDIILRLKKYTEGTFAGLLNNPTNIDMRNQLVVFSVRDLEDELRPLAIYTIVNYIWNIVRSELKRRLLVVDEAWWLMQHEDSAKFMYALVKRCRKYYLGVTTITQDVNDFLLSPYGQAIVNNSALQLLFRQSQASIDLVAKTFLLTEGERLILLDAEVGHGIFFAGSKHVAIRVIASYGEDQLITSDPQQLLEIERSKRAFEAEQSHADELDIG